MALPVSRALTQIPAQRGVAVVLQAGRALHIVAMEAAQVADVALFDRRDPRERFSCGRTIDCNKSIDVRVGTTLYSQRNTPLARIIEDSVGVHDLLLAPCSEQMFALRGQPAHPSCHDNLCRALAPFGIASDEITDTLNVFMDVRVGPDRTVSIHAPPVRPGDTFAIASLTDVIVGLTACSSELTNAGSCKPIGFAIV
jgi:uncharacterized protein YcgI (DUF1989 family)